MIKLGVIFGGPTVEHEVSIISAVQAMESLDKDKYEIYPIYIAKDRTWYYGAMLTDIDMYRDFDTLKKYAKRVVLFNNKGNFSLQSQGLFKSAITDLNKPCDCKLKLPGLFKSVIADLDVVLPIVHGNNVEDGSLQGYLETVGVPYVGSNVLGSSLGQDKVVMKQVFESEGIKIVPYTWFFDNDYYLNKDKILKDIKKLGYPVVVKPATLGSSIGITYVKNADDIENAIIEAFTYDVKVVVEKAIDNLVEVNCSVIGNYEKQQASTLEEVIKTEELLSYKDKYLGSSKTKGASKGMASASRIIPARITDKMTKEVQEMATKAFKALNLSGVCRIDFLINSKTKEVYINEPNTIPGSLSFYLWEATNKPYSEMLDEIITIAIKGYKAKNKKVLSFDTNILSNFSGVKGAKGVKGKLK